MTDAVITDFNGMNTAFLTTYFNFAISYTQYQLNPLFALNWKKSKLNGFVFANMLYNVNFMKLESTKVTPGKTISMIFNVDTT